MAMSTLGNRPPPQGNPITSVMHLRAAIVRATRRPPTDAQMAQIRDAAKTLKAEHLPWVANFLAANASDKLA